MALFLHRGKSLKLISCVLKDSEGVFPFFLPINYHNRTSSSLVKFGYCVDGEVKHKRVVKKTNCHCKKITKRLFDNLVPRAFSLRKWEGQEKTLASAGHMTQNCGCLIN